MKPDEKQFTLKAIDKIYIQVCSFSKAMDIFQKFWVSATTQKKSLQKGNAYYPAFSCFTRWRYPGIFYSNTYTYCLVAEFPVLEHLCSTSLYPIKFKKTSHISRKWKIEVVNALSECSHDSGMAFYTVSIWFQCFVPVSYL